MKIEATDDELREAAALADRLLGQVVVPAEGVGWVFPKEGQPDATLPPWVLPMAEVFEVLPLEAFLGVVLRLVAQGHDQGQKVQVMWLNRWFASSHAFSVAMTRLHAHKPVDADMWTRVERRMVAMELLPPPRGAFAAWR